MEKIEKELNDFEDNDFDLIQDTEELDFEQDNLESRYVKPLKQKHRSQSQIRFSNAETLVKKIDMKTKGDLFSIVDGSFIFGDFILAFLRYHDIKAVRMDISTLSLSLQNIIGIRTFIEKGYIENVNFLLGYYFYAHERKGLIREMYEQLDIDNKMQLAVCRNHTKITTILTDKGHKITIHGSSNLRSSDNLEQLHLTFNEEIHDFVTDFNNKVLEEYKTIQKPISNKKIKTL